MAFAFIYRIESASQVAVTSPELLNSLASGILYLIRVSYGLPVQQLGQTSLVTFMGAISVDMPKHLGPQVAGWAVLCAGSATQTRGIYR